MPNARYWLGESFYSMRNYDRAIREFDLLVRQHPGNSKVASAMLKQGYAYLEMGNKTQARRVLNDLQKQYPKSQEAKWAKERLSQVR
jgi:tol-pal system protein YbgF